MPKKTSEYVTGYYNTEWTTGKVTHASLLSFLLVWEDYSNLDMELI